MGPASGRSIRLGTRQGQGFLQVSSPSKCREAWLSSALLETTQMACNSDIPKLKKLLTRVLELGKSWHRTGSRPKGLLNYLPGE